MEKYDVIQFNENHKWRGCLGIITEIKDCGNIVILRKDEFIYPYSKTKSCGCWHREESSKRPKDKITGKYIKIERGE